VKVNSEGKLETITTALSIGTVIVSDIARIGTVSDIAHLGSIANTSFNQGAISDYVRYMYGYDGAGTARFIKIDTSGKLETVSTIEAGTISKVGTLGTISQIAHINNLGTLETVGIVQVVNSGKLDEVTRIGTVSDIAHLGSIANTSFDQGAISDHIRYMYGWEAPGTARFVKVDTSSNIPSDYMKHENDYDFQSYDLNTARASPGSTLTQAGESLTVFELSGSCSLRFNGTAKPAVLVNELTYPQMIVFDSTYTNVYLQNTSQSGKTVKLYFGKRT
jgi:hypothetical protein